MAAAKHTPGDAMNRHERRAARKWRVGDVINATTIRAVHKDGTTALYWVEVPVGMTNEEAANSQEWHGPFATKEEVCADQRATLLPPDCKVTEGGMWDPAWSKPQ
jgi:hypothetical protein